MGDLVPFEEKNLCRIKERGSGWNSDSLAVEERMKMCEERRKKRSSCEVKIQEIYCL